MPFCCFTDILPVINLFIQELIFDFFFFFFFSFHGAMNEKQITKDVLDDTQSAFMQNSQYFFFLSNLI